MIHENEEKYVKPYVDTLHEINNINGMFLSSYKVSREIIKLREYQEEFLLNLHTHKINVVVKCRQIGMTTTWLLHVLYELKKHVEENPYDTPQTYMYVAPNNNLAKCTQQICDYYEAQMFKGNKTLHKIYKDNVIFTSESNCHEKMCSRVISEVIFDEFIFFKHYDIIECLLGMGVRNIVFLTSFKDDESESSINKFLGKFKSTLDVHYTNIHWWECSVFNKNLMWKKIEVEPTIDKEGNVKYDKERWDRMIKEGWIPTSKTFEEITGMLGINKNEFFN